MIQIHLYSLASPLHSEMMPSAASDRFIKEIAALGKVEFVVHDDFSTWGNFSSDGSTTSPSNCREVLYIRTGGTEGLFLETFFKISPRATSVISSEVEKSRLLAAIPSSSAVISSEVEKSLHFTLLTSGESNSLAASMEILSFLRLRGIPGEIIHGAPADVADALAALPSFASVISSEVEKSLPITALPESKISPRAPLGRNDKSAILSSSSAVISSEVEKSLPVEGAERLLEGVRLGVVGRPSDWLISSDVDYAKARRQFGVEIVDVPMAELLEEIRRGGFSIPDAIRLNPLNVPLYGAPFAEGDFDKALEVYGALSRIVKKYDLQGLTLRCFDLLGTVGTTGCMALAILNAEGITATCEGDVPAMVTMAIAKKIAGTPGFQVNLSRIRDGRFLFAHCTVPLDIVKSYCYDRHFESGIGVAVHGEFAEGPVTIFKVGASMDRFFLAEAMLESNPYDNNLCRTQVILRPIDTSAPSPPQPSSGPSSGVISGPSFDALAPSTSSSGPSSGAAAIAAYFLREPLGNHHVIIPGDWSSVLRKACGA